jgi:hypothetical protein
MRILNKHGRDLQTAIGAQKNSPLSYKSEFRSIKVIETLFGNHPNFSRLENIRTNKSAWPMEHLCSVEKKKELQEALSLGNHKVATLNPILLRTMAEKDFTHGYDLVLPLDKLI